MRVAAPKVFIARCRPAATALLAARSLPLLPPLGRPLGLHICTGASQREQSEYLILQYDYTHHDAELLAKREPYLAEHLARCREMAARGSLLLWGSVGRPVESGMLIWRGAEEAEVQAFVKKDPLVVNGLVRHWAIKPFYMHVVEGE